MRLDGFMEFPRDIFAAMLLSPLGAAKAAEKSLAPDLEYSTRTYRHMQRSAGFHQNTARRR